MAKEAGKELTDAKGKVYRIPVRSINGNTNPRNPLSIALQKLGWTVFGPPPLTEEQKAIGAKPENHYTLWQLATNDDVSCRKRFVELMQVHDPDFCAWASTFITQGQLQPVEVREGGSGKFTLIFGCRRCLAILYNWCLTGKPSEPVVEARLAKGNEVSLLQRASVENTQRKPTLIEEAKAIAYQVNQGMTTSEVAESLGVSEFTVRNRLKLLELSVEDQKKIHEGKLTATAALSEKSSSESNGTPAHRPRKRKEIEEALKEFNEGEQGYKVLQWVLGQIDSLKGT